MGWVKGPEVPSRREERMDGQRCVLWIFLVKMQAGLSVNPFEKRGQWASKTFFRRCWAEQLQFL